MPESSLMRRIQVGVASLGARLWRNNVGLGWAGEAIIIKHPGTVAVCPGDVVIHHAHPLHAGLCEGSSDLVGLTPAVVTQEMAGRTVAIFTAIEVKQEGKKPTPAQAAFLCMVRELGGIAFVARSEDFARETLRNCQKDPRNAFSIES